eukprot:RCo050571
MPSFLDYQLAAEMLQKVVLTRSQLRTLDLAGVPAAKRGFLYALVSQTLKFFPVLSALVQQVLTPRLATTGLDNRASAETVEGCMLRVLVYELLFGQGLPPGIHSEETLLLREFELNLRTALETLAAGGEHSELLRSRGQNGRGFSGAPFRYARVNTLRATVKEALQRLQDELGIVVAPTVAHFPLPAGTKLVLGVHLLPEQSVPLSSSDAAPSSSS